MPKCFSVHGGKQVLIGLRRFGKRIAQSVFISCKGAHNQVRYPALAEHRGYMPLVADTECFFEYFPASVPDRIRYLVKHEHAVSKALQDPRNTFVVGHFRREKTCGRIRRTEISAVYRMILSYLPFYFVFLQKRQKRMIHGALGKL